VKRTRLSNNEVEAPEDEDEEEKKLGYLSAGSSLLGH
jgi:hypothetical protein